MSVSAAGKVAQVRVGDLTVANQPDEHVVGEWQVVGPKIVARQRLDPIDGDADVSCSVTGTEKVPNECSLRDRTSREHLVVVGEPVAGSPVMDMIGVDQGDQNVGVQ
jgi:hypothetical protein